MANLYFSYAAMNAGKSTILLQAAHNYRERGMIPYIMLAAVDDRHGRGVIKSRIGLEDKAYPFEPEDNLYEHIDQLPTSEKPDAIFVDEAQFLTDAQVWQLAHIADQLNIPVLAYGLRTDFQGKLFPGSAALLAIADNIREIRTICWCGSKATMVLRLDRDGHPVADGEQVKIGGNDRYISLCRQHWTEQKTAPDDGR